MAPGWISEKFEAEQTALGQVEKSRFFTVSNGIHFEVQRWNYPSKVFESISEDEILDGEISAVAGLVGGSVADKKVVIINSHRGREGRIQNHSGGKNLIFVRVFVEKSTTYRLIIISPTPNSERASVSTFLNSFRLH